MKGWGIMLACLVWLFPVRVWAEEAAWTGKISTEVSIFPETPLFDDQRRVYPSLAMQWEYYRSWDNGRQSFTLVPFFRLDALDSERTHGDIRELTWLMAEGPWELRLGIRKLFWGVTESQHLVDIINQTDGVENLEGDEKLGQPMVNVSFSGDSGTVDLFLLPFFRERTFAGWDGRPHAAWPVDRDQVRYESPAKMYHMDWAVRWFHTMGDWDVGVSHFSGTGRDPLFVTGDKGAEGLFLMPYYVLIHQTGLDVQTTRGGWLLKGEIISRAYLEERYSAATGGFEYTLVGVLDSDADVGIIGEYLFDDRHDNATTPFSEDVMVGLRLTLNDVQSTDVLLGSIVDPESGAMAWKLEGNRRLGDHWKLSAEGRFFVDIPSQDPLHIWRRDTFLKVELTRYF